MDQIAVLVDGRLVFQGSPEAARRHFSISRLTALYDALQSADPTSLPAVDPVDGPDLEERRPQLLAGLRRRKPAYFAILVQRLATIFRADPKNVALLIGQPIIIGLLVRWVTNDLTLIAFFTYISALWFGCSNSAQEIVRELPIYRRERLVGLQRTSYLLSKFAWFGLLTTAQTVLVMLVTGLTQQGLGQGAGLRFLGLFLVCLAGTGIGLLISTLARSALQAAMMVPLILIPQILFSGFTVPLSDMPAAVALVAQLMPSFAAEQIVDVSFLLNKQISGALARDFRVPYSNLNEYRRRSIGERLRSGDVYGDTGPLKAGCFCLLGWTVFGFVGSYFLLARKERE
jgi:hypothetical protein